MKVDEMVVGLVGCWAACWVDNWAALTAGEKADLTGMRSVACSAEPSVAWMAAE